jgi:hypothetical protein
MAPKPKVPIVIYWIRREGDPEFGFGYLVQYPDGSAYCYPAESTAEKQPSLSGGFQIDPQHLRAQPDTGADRPLYLYAVEVPAPLEAQKTLPPTPGNYQER